MNENLDPSKNNLSADELEIDKSLRTLKKIQQELNARWSEVHKTQCSAQLFSSLKKQGVEEATQKIEAWLS